MGSFDVIAMDADDTLWHSEVHFVDVEDRFRDLLTRYVDDADVDGRLLEVERRNLAVLGYGVKAFTLSMVETAIEITGGEVRAADIHEIITWGKEMMAHPVELLDGVAETVHQLAETHRLAVITKGDLFHQEAKLAESGLADVFAIVEIVSEKDTATYQRILDRHAISPEGFVMVGNSVRSDILPVLAVGGQGVHIPYHVTWAVEQDHAEPAAPFHTLSRVADLPALIEALEALP